MGWLVSLLPNSPCVSPSSSGASNAASISSGSGIRFWREEELNRIEEIDGRRMEANECLVGDSPVFTAVYRDILGVSGGPEQVVAMMLSGEETRHVRASAKNEGHARRRVITQSSAQQWENRCRFHSLDDLTLIPTVFRGRTPRRTMEERRETAMRRC